MIDLTLKEMQSRDTYLSSGVILLVSLSRRSKSFKIILTMLEKCVYPEEAVIKERYLVSLPFCGLMSPGLW